MGVMLSDELPKACNEQQCINNIPGDLHVLKSSKFPVLHENNWLTVSTTFQATGNERFLILAHHKNVNKHLSDSNVISYLFDNVKLKKLEVLSPSTLEIFFEEASSEIDSFELEKIKSLTNKSYEKIIVRGYASDVGSLENNRQLSEDRCKSSVTVLQDIFPRVEIVSEVVGEINSLDKSSFQKVEIDLIKEENLNSKQLPSQKEIMELIKTLDVLYRRDQYEIEKSLKKIINDEELGEFQQSQEATVDSILNLNYLFDFCFDNRTETNLVTLFLHASDSTQGKFFEKFKTANLNGFISNKNWAYIYDRQAMINSEPQLYGTQYRIEGDKKKLYKISNIDQLNERRNDMGLKPFTTKELEKISNEN